VNDTKRLPGHEGRPFVGQLDPGARVGRYQILGALGRGGMGEVYAAYHPDLDRRIALKVVYGFGDVRGERRVRLLREARAIARLSHPNVVTVHDAGTFGDRVFIAMELIDGRTIDRGSAPRRGRGGRSWTHSSPPGAGWPRRTRRASSTAISNPRTS
jgi:serine/threonine protein kinase